jgi:ankyrin repeat protein
MMKSHQGSRLKCSTLLVMTCVFLISLCASQSTFANNGAELTDAGWNGDVAKVQALLAQGTDVNSENEFGKTALHLTSEAGHEAVVKLLLARVRTSIG